MKSHIYTGCLIGIAVGDSLGLPTEKLSRRQVQKRYPGSIKQSLIGRWGMCSDDTEHSFFVAQTLLTERGNPKHFQKRLARKLRWWFLAGPAGIGRATLRSCLKLWLGFPAHKAAVNSAGNGPAMRAPLIGAYFSKDADYRHDFLLASSALSHSHPAAIDSAQTIGDLAAALTAPDCQVFQWLIKHHDENPQFCSEWRQALQQTIEAITTSHNLDEVADVFELTEGVSGYSLHTVPMVLATLALHQNEPEVGIEQLIRCGGDTDTTAAIAGGLFGIIHGPDIWPDDWVSSIHNGPMSIAVLIKAGEQLSQNGQPVRWSWPLIPIRNLIFLLIVLAHGFRRLIP